MLIPTKFSHPDKTVLAASTVILKRLRAKRIESYSNLLAHASKTLADLDVLFVPSLAFLYLLGLVEYRPKIDSFEYLGQ